MKRVFKFRHHLKSIVALLIILFTMNSCKDKETCAELGCDPGYECIDGACVYIVPTCDACGTYEGLSSGTINTQFQDSTFTNIPILINNTEGAIAFDYTVQIDISTFLGAAAGTLVIEVNGTLNGNTITISNQTYVYQGVASIDVDGSIVLDPTFANLSGALTFSDAVIGTISFTAVRQ